MTVINPELPHKINLYQPYLFLQPAGAGISVFTSVWFGKGDIGGHVGGIFEMCHRCVAHC
jgi:hypothetical protein